MVTRQVLISASVVVVMAVALAVGVVLYGTHHYSPDKWVDGDFREHAPRVSDPTIPSSSYEDPQILVRLVQIGDIRKGPTRPFRTAVGIDIGVEFRLQPGWHIYGQEPGDIGLPTTIEFQLPLGVSYGKNEWPATQPFSFRISPDQPLIASQGYSGKVTVKQELLSESERFLVGAPVEVSVSWLACSDTTCIPGEAVLIGYLGTSVPRISGEVFGPYLSTIVAWLFEDAEVPGTQVSGSDRVWHTERVARRQHK